MQDIMDSEEMTIILGKINNQDIERMLVNTGALQTMADRNS